MTHSKADLIHVRTKVLACLEAGPKLSHEISDALDIDGARLSNRIRAMLIEGVISRREITAGRYRYYIGQTSGEQYKPFKARARQVTRHAIPTKVVTIRPLATEGYSSLSAFITMPAAPWETEGVRG